LNQTIHSPSTNTSTPSAPIPGVTWWPPPSLLPELKRTRIPNQLQRHTLPCLRRAPNSFSA
jgi:hypothetical protein